MRRKTGRKCSWVGGVIGIERPVVPLPLDGVHKNFPDFSKTLRQAVRQRVEFLRHFVRMTSQPFGFEGLANVRFRGSGCHL